MSVMSIHDTDFSRCIRSSIPPSPAAPARYANKGMDVFGDITLPMRNNSPGGMNPVGKGKAVMREYGDR